VSAPDRQKKRVEAGPPSHGDVGSTVAAGSRNESSGAEIDGARSNEAADTLGFRTARTVPTPRSARYSTRNSSAVQCTHFESHCLRELARLIMLRLTSSRPCPTQHPLPSATALFGLHAEHGSPGHELRRSGSGRQTLSRMRSSRTRGAPTHCRGAQPPSGSAVPRIAASRSWAGGRWCAVNSTAKGGVHAIESTRIDPNSPAGKAKRSGSPRDTRARYISIEANKTVKS